MLKTAPNCLKIYVSGLTYLQNLTLNPQEEGMKGYQEINWCSYCDQAGLFWNYSGQIIF